MQRCAYLSPGISWLWAAVATVYGKQFWGNLFVLNHFQADSKQLSRIVKVCAALLKSGLLVRAQPICYPGERYRGEACALRSPCQRPQKLMPVHVVLERLASIDENYGDLIVVPLQQLRIGSMNWSRTSLPCSTGILSKTVAWSKKKPFAPGRHFGEAQAQYLSIQQTHLFECRSLRPQHSQASRA